MSGERYNNINSDDEDDLESLRLAALKSINLKKDSSPNKNQTKYQGIGNTKLHMQIDKSILANQEGGFSNMTHQINQQPNTMTMQSYGMNPDSDGIRQVSHPPYFPQTQSYQQTPTGHMGVYIPLATPYIPPIHPNAIVHPSAPIVNLPRPPSPVRHWLQQEPISHNGSVIYNANKTVAPYTPKPILKDTHVTDVQLSPRSLAFVAQNNGILARRKIEADLSPKKHYRRSKSPNYRRISRSPSPLYRPSPGRWTSVSPPPHSLRQRFSKTKSKTPPRRSRSKPFQYNYKRSRSRSSSGSGHARHISERKRRSFSRNSDYRPLSPSHHNRHSSRSPITSNKGGNVIKRNKSRSPLQRRYSPISNLPHRRLSRSRSPRRNYFEVRRSRSPQTIKRRPSPSGLNKRNQRRPIDRKSPIRNKRKSPMGRDMVRRDSPLQSNNYNRRLVRKSLSPQPRKRSRTPRSPANMPNKKFIRKSRDRQINSTISNSQTQYTSTIIRKRSPIVNTFKTRNIDSYNINNNSNNNNNSSNNNNIRIKMDQDIRKSKSPIRKRRSRSKTLEKTVEKESEMVYSCDSDKKLNQKPAEEQINKAICNVSKSKDILEKPLQKPVKEAIGNKDEESKTPPPSEDNFESLTPPIEKDIDDAKLIEEIDAMLGDNKSSKSDSSDEEDDGIDLFASEESESENEGRFKSSNKSERNSNIQAMSFTKLKESSITNVSNVRNLQDVVSDEKYNDNKNKNRRDYFKKYCRNTVKSNSRRHCDDYSSSKRRSRSTSADKKKFSDSNDNTNKIKFKSTFQIIKNEGSRILSKASPKSNIRSTPERNVKKRSKDNNSSELKDRKSAVQNMNTPPHLLEQLRTNSSQFHGTQGHEQQKKTKILGTSKSKSSISRKSIHSRLGAMTNTFKSTTKSSWDMSTSYNDQV